LPNFEGSVGDCFEVSHNPGKLHLDKILLVWQTSPFLSLSVVFASSLLHFLSTPNRETIQKKEQADLDQHFKSRLLELLQGLGKFFILPSKLIEFGRYHGILQERFRL
jgi:hypothetical protein